MLKTIKTLVLLTGVLSVVVFPALADRTNLTPARNLFTVQQDIEMGRLLANELEAAIRVVTDQQASAYIDALGKQLSLHAPGSRYPYQFRIVDNDTLNA